MSTTLDRSRPPLQDALRPFSFPALERHRLGNGIRVLLLERRGVGLATAELLAPGGGAHAPADRPGLAAFTAGAIEEGTSSSNATDLARRIERLGGSLSSGCDWDASSVSMSLLSEHQRESLDLLAEVVQHAAFEPATIERLRRERIAEIERRRQDPESLAGLTLSKAIYGDEIYGGPLLGNVASIEELGRDELVQFYRSTVHSRSAALIATGDFDREALLGTLDDSIGSLNLTEPPKESTPVISLPEGIRVHLVDRPEGAQAELRVGHAGPPRAEEGRAARLLLNSILGGKFTSRLNLNLREKHGYTYGVSSRFVDRLGAGPFLVSTAVANDVAGAATQEILSELQRLVEEPVGQHELEDARSYLLGVFPYTLQTVQGLAGRLEELVVYDLPDDSFDRVRAEMLEVSVADIQEAAGRWLSPSALHIVGVGPIDQLESQLAALGTVTRHTAENIAGARG